MKKYSKILCDEKNYSKKDGLMYVIVKGDGNDIEMMEHYKTFKKANEYATNMALFGIKDVRILTLSN